MACRGPNRSVGSCAAIACAVIWSLADNHELWFSRASAWPVAAPSVVDTTGSLAGRVVDGDTGAGVSGAAVTLLRESIAIRRSLSNAAGEFVVADVPEGRYELTASKTGYVPGAYGRRWASGPSAPFLGRPGQRARDIALPIWKQASISGRVYDDGGEPVVQVEVGAYETLWVSGQRVLRRARTGITNDRGEFRLSSLAPGEYIVGIPLNRTLIPSVASSRQITTQDMELWVRSGSGSLRTAQGNREGVYAPVFFPMAKDPSTALVMNLQSGDHRAGVDFRLAQVPGFTIRGRVVHVDEKPVPLANVHLRIGLDAPTTSAEQFEVVSTITDSRGQFVLPGVPSGQYRLIASRMPLPVAGSAADSRVDAQRQTRAMELAMLNAILGSKNPGEGVRRTRAPGNESSAWGSEDVFVSDRDLSMMLRLSLAARVTGRIAFDGIGHRPSGDELHSLSVTLEPVDRQGLGFVPPSAFAKDGTFVSSDVPPGRYFVRISGQLPGWTLKSLLSAQVDYADLPLELGSADRRELTVVLSNPPMAVLSGTVRTNEGAPVNEGVVFVFPQDSKYWKEAPLASSRFARTAVTNSGSYAATDLFPGEYLAVAVRDIVARDWQKPGFLASLANGAARLTIHEGQTLGRDLKISVGGR